MRDEGGRAHLPGERHRVPEAERPRERAEPRVVRGLIAVRADEQQVRVGVHAAAVVREHPQEIVMPLVRRHAPDEEELALDRAPAREDRGVRRHVVRAPVDEQGHVRRLAEAELREVLAVELGDADAEVDARREPLELPQAEPGVRGGVVVDAGEELRRRDVVVDEDAPRIELHELVEDLAPDGEVEDERVARPHGAEEPAVRKRVDAVLHLERVGLGLVAPLAQPPAKREDVVAHRVARREHRVELMDRGHDGLQPVTA